MRNSNESPTVNAGSMADIAFLLLIFFLVTTTIPNDKGIARKLPAICVDPPCSERINERNILRIALNKDGALMVENDLTTMSELKNILKSFIDNNGDSSCTYCKGEQSKESSDNPQTAVISLYTDRESEYKDFIAIQVELTAAYYDLRDEFIKRKFNKHLSELSSVELQEAKDAYPFLISEADVQ